MHKRFLTALMLCGLCITFSACGPSDEKMAQAQQKYMELVEIHNQAVEAHKEVADNSLDNSLTDLQEEIAELEDYDLTEMKDEDIDSLIREMDGLIGDYQESLDTLGEMKAREDAAVLTPIAITLTNQTDVVFTGLCLYEEGDAGMHQNVLEGLEELAPGETLAGLKVQRDMENTPWILGLTDAQGTVFEFSLPVGEYDEDGVRLALNYDAEHQEFRLDIFS